MAGATDTLKIYERLKAANLDERAAKEIAEVFNDIIEDRLATKRDLKELEDCLRRDIRELELRLTVKLGALMALAVGIVATLLRLR
jgi:uncharacterized membrane protein YheB (UPF0754 family)